MGNLCIELFEGSDTTRVDPCLEKKNQTERESKPADEGFDSGGEKNQTERERQQEHENDLEFEKIRKFIIAQIEATANIRKKFSISRTCMESGVVPMDRIENAVRQIQEYRKLFLLEGCVLEGEDLTFLNKPSKDELSTLLQKDPPNGELCELFYEIGNFFFNSTPRCINYSLQMHSLFFLARGFVLVTKKRLYGDYLILIGSVLKLLAMSEVALDITLEALKIYVELGDKQCEARALNNLGKCHKSLCQFNQAIEFFRKSQIVQNEIGEKIEEGKTFLEIGMCYKFIGEKCYHSAMKNFDTSNQIGKACNDKLIQAESLLQMGKIHDLVQNYDPAIRFHAQSLILFNKMNLWERMAEVAVSIAAIHSQNGNIPRSIINYRQAEKIVTHILHDVVSELKIVYSIANLLYSQKNLVEALVEYRKVKKLFESLKQMDEAQGVARHIRKVENELVIEKKKIVQNVWKI